MPNHVISELVFTGLSDEQRTDLLAFVYNDEGHVDFSILVPPPMNMWMGNVGTKHEKAFGRTGLDWNRENWGTKWNAYESTPACVEGDATIIRFQTAWSPPYPWLAAIFNKTELGFQHNWLDEGASTGWCGVFEIKGPWGNEWNEEGADDAMNRHLHKLLWGVEEFGDEDV